MIVIRRPLQEGEKNKVEYNVDLNNDGIIFSFSTTYMGQDVKDSVSIPFNTYKDVILHLSLQWTHKIETRLYPLYELQSRYNVISETNNDALVLARISINETCDDIVIFLNSPTDYTCKVAKTIDCEPNTSKSKMMMMYSPYYTKRAEHIRKKWDMMANLDIYDTVTYLESQVDALTKIALGNDSDDVKAVLTAADEHSVFNIKSKEKMIDEMHKDKAKIRSLQKEYYDKA